MSEDFHAQFQARRVHIAAVPLAIGKVQAHLVDFDGSPLADGAQPIEGLHCGELRTLLKEIERLTAEVKRQQEDAREAEREFRREARDIAAEARWEERQGRDGDYGSY